ncbi:MAG: HDIG domain-containing protein [Candidatus Omnitrophota bacterium]|jgi:putative nucleotidyltransferase with HDIG domain|nr:MAG: HDIG domain-containing protein [Candidatus Omnitrophota bacterium]
MIKQAVINKAKFFFISILILIVGYIVGINLIVPVFILTLATYFKYRKTIYQKESLLELSLLYLIGFATSYFILNNRLSVFLIPFCVIPMLAAILYNNLEVSFLLSLSYAFSVASLYGNNLNLGLLFLISGVASGIFVFGLRRRMVIIRTGIIIGVLQVALLLIIDRFSIGDPSRYTVLFINGIISSVVVLGVLPIFEYLFGTITNISLLELADFNHPLMQRMIMEAPGTYHHSLIVGNLAEAACSAVGANALLSRVGAYYHDIGKLDKPEYFSENQQLDRSKHEDLSPSMSKLVIMNHVKEGVDLAKKYKINRRLIDFIQQHHGDSLVYYFYRRALENVDGGEEVNEEGFRYPGPKPATKETAIVLLADSVEAATRSLKDFSPNKIEEEVHKIINNKFIDGQLDECELTLKDLENISKVFIRILSGIYHVRVSYPEKNSNSEDSYKKPSEESLRQSSKGKKSSA